MYQAHRDDAEFRMLVEEYQMEKLSRIPISDGDKLVYVSDENEEKIGFSVYSLGANGNTLKSIYVIPDKRRHGYASSLLREIFSSFGDWTIRFSNKNKPAKKLFQSILRSHNYSIEKLKSGEVEIVFNVNNCGVKY